MRVLLRFTLAFGLASAGMLAGSFSSAAAAVACILLIPGILLCVKKPEIGTILLGLSLGTLWTWGFGMLVMGPAESLAGQTVTVSGTATDYSEPTTYGICVPARIEVDGKTVRALVWLYFEEELEPGDQFTVTAELRSADEGNSFYNRSDGVFLRAYGKGTPEIIKALQTDIRYAPHRIARRMEQTLKRCVPEDAAGFAVALTTGNRAGIRTGQRDLLKITGIYHMLAISGLHLSILTGFVSKLFRRKKTNAAVGIPLCVLYALITGGSVSVVRAAVMQTLVLMAPLCRREADLPTSLGAAGLLLTVQNPWCLFSAALQLSFASVAGIYLFADKLSRLFSGSGEGKQPGILRAAIAAIATTLAASALTVPLMMAYFGRISLIAPVTNLLTVFAVGLCLPGCLFTALAGLLFPAAGQLLGWLTAWPIRYILGVAGILSRVPFAAISTGTGYGVCWVVFLYLILVLLYRTRYARPVAPVCCILLGLIACLFFSVSEYNGFSMTVLDVGQGQCLILSSRGQTMVVDCGGSVGEAAGDLAADRLSEIGEDRIDALILTHFDSDHVSGVEELMSRIRVDKLIIPDTDHQRAEPFERLAREGSCEEIMVDGKTTMNFGDGRIVLFPPVTAEGGNSGLSLLSESESRSVLITGDMDSKQEAALLHQFEIPPVDVLVAGHHGAETSTSELLLKRTAPKIVVISVGRNRYGHPAEETITRIRDAGAVIYRTDLYGTIVLKGA
ncbi:MAG: DNA internalization-related competence protein ComEC/Rec2 [Oscillospiraceae bacterium]|nr:DNA internalization-related competence protein ComEC/Rec2 [Oscillospiraceae bacterium]